MSMTSSRPYIVRALYEWILENDCTPYILINALADDVHVPQQYVKKGQIVLNISPTAVVDLELSNDTMTFNGRFGGVPMDIYAPMSAVMGIYAQENGQGMIFEIDGPTDTPPDDTGPSDSNVTSLGNKKPGLRIVKYRPAGQCCCWV